MMHFNLDADSDIELQAKYADLTISRQSCMPSQVGHSSDVWTSLHAFDRRLYSKPEPMHVPTKSRRPERIPQDHQVCSTIENQVAEWQRIRTFVSVTGCSVHIDRPAPTCILPVHQGREHLASQTGALNTPHSPTCVQLASLCSSDLAPVIPYNSETGDTTPQVGDLSTLSGDRKTKESCIPPAGGEKGSDLDSLVVVGTAAIISHAVDDFEQEETLAEHGSTDEVLYAHGENVDCTPPNQVQDGTVAASDRDVAAMKVGLPPVEPQVALLHEASEIVLLHIWNRLAKPLADLVAESRSSDANMPIDSGDSTEAVDSLHEMQCLTVTKRLAAWTHSSSAPESGTDMHAWPLEDEHPLSAPVPSDFQNILEQHTINQAGHILVDSDGRAPTQNEDSDHNPESARVPPLRLLTACSPLPGTPASEAPLLRIVSRKGSEDRDLTVSASTNRKSRSGGKFLSNQTSSNPTATQLASQWNSPSGSGPWDQWPSQNRSVFGRGLSQPDLGFGSTMVSRSRRGSTESARLPSAALPPVCGKRVSMDATSGDAVAPRHPLHSSQQRSHFAKQQNMLDSSTAWTPTLGKLQVKPTPPAMPPPQGSGMTADSFSGSSRAADVAERLKSQWMIDYSSKQQAKNDAVRPQNITD